MGMGIRGGAAARQIQALLDAGALAGLGDGELLGKFLGRDDSAEPAFATLVDRHGRMVLRVCRDVLGDPHEAQDAAQATFFILARKAAAIRKPDALPGWLHGTARRVAARALRRSIRRRKHERRAAEEAPRASDPGEERPRAWPELHEELSRLPDRYREPIVLCDLAGLTHEQAAGKLGCPPRTLQTRLYRGRERLKDRLVRRGVAPSMASVAIDRAAEAGAAPPPHWAGSTAGAAVRLAGKGSWAAAGDVPAAAVRHAREHVKGMAMIKVKWGAAAGVLVGLAGAGAWSMVVPAGDGRPGARVTDDLRREVAVEPSKPKDAFEQAYALADGEDVKLLTGPVIEARNAHYKGQWNKVGFGGDPVDRQVPFALLYRWRDGGLAFASMTTAAPKTLRDLMVWPLVGVTPAEIEGDPSLLAAPVDGDFVVREGAPASKIVAQLGPILRREVRLPVRLSLVEETREVVVVRGRYRYTATWGERPLPESFHPTGERLEIFAGTLEPYNPRKDRVFGGYNFAGLLSELGQFVGRPVIDEVEKRPKGRFDFSISDSESRKNLGPEARARVLKHLIDQTGLSFVEESRKVRVLRVERAD